jgi:hypothetical protein
LVGCSGPEKEVEKYYVELEELMAEHLDEPATGVEKMIGFLEENGAELMAAETELLISLALIEKDGDREARIQEAGDALQVTAKNFKGTSERFFEAVMKDEQAKALFMDFKERTRQARQASVDGGMRLF